MSSEKRERLAAEAFERRVKLLQAAGFSLARIAKDTGKTYQHTQRIANRIKAEQERGDE